jgi:hypothetical protein
VSENKVLSISRKYSCECNHNQFTYDEDTREIFCGKCDKVLDPIAVLKRFSISTFRAREQLVTYKAEIEKLEKRKRIKCHHCGRFTKINLNLTWSDRNRVIETQKEKRQ